jgi:hypothetical protein
MHTEQPAIILNGQRLTMGQVVTLHAALDVFAETLEALGAPGDEE